MFSKSFVRQISWTVDGRHSLVGCCSDSISGFRTIGLQLSWNMSGRHSLGPDVLSIDCVFMI
jgi:hypothetical protein